MSDDPFCPKCNGPTAGWVCAICGVESDVHNVHHIHAGSDRYCTMMCQGCGLADVHCTCARPYDGLHGEAGRDDLNAVEGDDLLEGGPVPGRPRGPGS